MRLLRRGGKRPREPSGGSARAAAQERSRASRRREIRPLAGLRRRARRLAGSSTLQTRARAARTAGLDLARLLAGALQEIGRAIVAIGEALGRLELKLARVLSVPLLGLLRVGRAAIRAGERVVTPARGVGVVVLAAAILLGASQFVDYRGVEIGVPQYEGVEAVAPPPQTDREPAGSAHSYLLLPVAVLAIGALAFALRGRWQLGRAISLLGLVGVAVTLLVDMPTGLDEGMTARSFEGARATLIEGFWVQLSAASVLVVVGVLLGRYVRLQGEPARRRVRRSARGARRRATRAAGVRA
jgi:hypothetical protein